MIGDAAVRAAWAAVEIDTSLAMDEGLGEQILQLWALVPENLPLPGQWFDPELVSGIGWGWDECHDRKHPSFGAYYRDETGIRAAELNEVVGWYLAEGAAAGWQVTESAFVDKWTGDEIGTLLQFNGFGDVWNVIVTEFHGVSVNYCPAA